MKLTEEQLQQLKNLNDNKVNEILGFTTLEVGKWYKYIENNEIYGLLMYNNGKKATGFWNGNYKENFWGFSPDKHIANNSVPATIEEVKEALIKEAKKRGFKNVGDLSLICVNGHTFKRGFFYTHNNMFYFQEGDNTLRLDGVEIFNNGKWAEIIDDKLEIKDEIKQIEQRLKELRDKL